MTTSEPDDGQPSPAEVAVSAEGLTALLTERPPYWRWTAFASVLVQRRAGSASTLRDHHMGFAPLTGERIRDKGELVDYVIDSLHDVEQIGQQVNDFVLNPTFVGVFDERDREDSADAAGILHAANRLMDFYVRYIELARRSRGVAAPVEFVTVLSACARLVDKPLSGFDECIDGYVGVVTGMHALVQGASGQTVVREVKLTIAVDDELAWHIVQQLTDL
jgi:hypothetical protein